jgi:heme exporter protein A
MLRHRIERVFISLCGFGTMTLQAHQLAFSRGDRQLFDRISFEVDAGEALWLTGGNGSGKTSLLRLLCGLSLPTAGEVRWNGRNIRSLREDYSRDLVYCGHATGVKEDLTAWENVAIGLELSGKSCTRLNAFQALEESGLAHVAHLPARVLSQGQRKRVALARLRIAPTPKILILDEPFTALDQNAVDALSEVLSGHLAQGCAIVYTTHQQLLLKARHVHRLDLSQAA